MSDPGYRAEHLIIPGLKHFVLETLEPAIGMLTGYERQNPRGEERCFKSANTMRRGCAPYFAALAGAMLELKFGVDPEGEFFTSEKRDRAQRGGDMELFPMLATWMMVPQDSADELFHTRAAKAIRKSAGAGYHIGAMKSAMASLYGPLGRYSTRLRLGEIEGTLRRCDRDYAHTYLLFTVDGDDEGADDVLIDPSWKHQLLVPEWMEERHFKAAQARDFCAILQNAAQLCACMNARLTAGAGPGPLRRPARHLRRHTRRALGRALAPQASAADARDLEQGGRRRVDRSRPRPRARLEAR